MKIGIHIGSAFSKEKTGVEEYAFRLIKNISKLDDAKKHQFVLYSNPKNNIKYPDLPDNFEIKELRSPFFWTKLRLSLEIIKNPPDVLFVLANFLPLFYPKNTIVTIHGVEFDFCPEGYTKKQIYYLKQGTSSVIKKAKKIIAVSENTKNDLVEFYGADQEKISVVHHGVYIPEKTNLVFEKEKYILYLGRIETKKNIDGILKSFETAKKKYNIPHKLILIGGGGKGFLSLKKAVEGSPQKENIKMLGYVKEGRKEEILKHADMFLFPSFYEGFGMPILEAQSEGVPVITSNTSSMPEVAGEGALFVDPKNTESIVDAIYKLAQNEKLRKDLIEKGFKNIQKYSWEKCAQETLNVLVKSL